MAEIILGSVANSIADHLVSLISSKIKQASGVRGELKKLESTVSAISAVFREAEKCQIEDEGVKDWLKKLREVFYDVDDLLDDFSTEVLRQRLMGGNQIVKEFRIFFSCSNQLAYSFNVAHQVKDIREKLVAIKEEKLNFEFKGSGAVEISENRVRRDSHPFVRETRVIGRDGDKKKIIDFLLDPNFEENVSILSLVGLGGQGKTTLAKLVFHDERIQTYFSPKLWVCVSMNFDVENIVRKILRECNDAEIDVGSYSMNDLQRELRVCLCGRKFFLVLDDVPDEYPRGWMELQDMLMDGAQGSKILVTARALSIATAMKAAMSHKLNGLKEAESPKLLMQMASKDSKPEHERKEFEAIGKDIINKCAGVPLAIMTIGQLLLSSRNREENWLNFKNLDLSRVNKKEGDIIPTLKLSYDSLPLYLKQCFAYCSLFPKSHVLDPLELTRMWIAQGFIATDGTKTAEEVAQDYFMDLVWRSFFQDIDEDIYGNVIGCKMHDLMHDLAEKVARDNCFTLGAPADQIIPKGVLYVSSYLDDFQLKTDERDYRLRTCLLINRCRGQADCPYQFDRWIPGLKKLRALCLPRMANLCILPTSIGKLKHLRHLDLSHNRDLKVLPLSIGNLCNLEILNLEGCVELKELPRGITKLVNLRQLDTRGCAGLTHIPKGIGKLTRLQMLGQFVVGVKGDLNAATLDELKDLNKLKSDLDISGLEKLHGSSTTFPVEALNLQSLELLWATQRQGDHRALSNLVLERENEVLESLRPHQDLKGLTVEGYRGGTFSTWVSLLHKLVILEIRSCHNIKRLPHLDQLPQLKMLLLSKLSQLECIELSEGNEQHWMSRCFFPSIKELWLTYLPKFEGWKRRMQQGGYTHSKEEDLQMLPAFGSKVQVEIYDCPRLSHMQIQGQNLLLVGLTDNKLEQLGRMGMASKPASMVSVYSISLAELKSITIHNMVDAENLHLPKKLLQSFLSLQSLVIKDCHPLKTVCGRVILRHLTNLETFRICNCPEFDLSIEDDGDEEDYDESTCDDCLQGHSKLRALQIDQLPKMEHFPQWFQHLSHLDHLSISDCNGLKALPHWMCNLTSLTSLNISGCKGLRSLPRRLIFHFLTTLESLRIEWCPELDLSGQLCDQEEGNSKTSSCQSSVQTKLHELAIIGSTSMMSLPGWIKYLSNLESLDISFCENLKALPEWFLQLTSLKRLDVSMCGQLSERCIKDAENWLKIRH